MTVIESTNDFFIQKINVSVWRDASRRPGFFKQYCENKTVLHIGCSDAPFPFNPGTSLHCQLNAYTKSLDGFDLNTDNFEQMKQTVPGNYYNNSKDLEGKEWDVCLAPETIEHVDNIKEFCEFLYNINAKTFIVTAPNAFHPNNMENRLLNDQVYIEGIHPDHKVWFSPYTLTHCIRSYMPLAKIRQVWLIENENMIAIVVDKV